MGALRGAEEGRTGTGVRRVGQWGGEKMEEEGMVWRGDLNGGGLGAGRGGDEAGGVGENWLGLVNEVEGWRQEGRALYPSAATIAGVY